MLQLIMLLQKTAATRRCEYSPIRTHTHSHTYTHTIALAHVHVYVHHIYINRRMLQLIMLVQNTAATRRCDYRLELALLSFMDKLKQGLLYVDAAMENEKEAGMYVYIYMYIYIYVCIYVHVYKYTHILHGQAQAESCLSWCCYWTRKGVRYMCVCLYVNRNRCICICVYTHVYVYINMYVYIYMHMYVSFMDKLKPSLCSCYCGECERVRYGCFSSKHLYICVFTYVHMCMVLQCVP